MRSFAYQIVIHEQPEKNRIYHSRLFDVCAFKDLHFSDLIETKTSKHYNSSLVLLSKTVPFIKYPRVHEEITSYLDYIHFNRIA